MSSGHIDTVTIVEYVRMKFDFYKTTLCLAVFFKRSRLFIRPSMNFRLAFTKEKRADDFKTYRLFLGFLSVTLIIL